MMIFDIHINKRIGSKKNSFTIFYKNCKNIIRDNQLFIILLYTNNDILSLSFSLLVHLFLVFKKMIMNKMVDS